MARGAPAQSGCLCLPLRPARPARGVGPRSALALVHDHPCLLSTRIFQRPLKLFVLLRHVEAGAVRKLCDGMPPDVLGAVLPQLLQDLSHERIAEVVAPLINDASVCPALLALVQVLDARCITLVINSVLPGKLGVVLQSPPDRLAALVAAVNTGRFSDVLVPVLNEPDVHLKATLVPMLREIRHPERLAAVINQVETDVLLWVLRGVQAVRLANFVDALDAADFEENGCLITLLQALGDERGLTRNKVLPLLQFSETAIIVQLVQQVKPKQLLDVLRCVDVTGVALVLENTNIELVVRLFNGPLEAAVANVAGSLAHAMRNPVAASTLRQLTDALNNGLVNADKAVQDTREAVLEVVRLGKVERGVQDTASYNFGDFTRGLIAHTVGKSGEGFREPSADDAAKADFGQLTSFAETVDRGKELFADALEIWSSKLEVPLLNLPHSADRCAPGAEGLPALSADRAGALVSGGTEPGEHGHVSLSEAVDWGRDALVQAWERRKELLVPVERREEGAACTTGAKHFAEEPERVHDDDSITYECKLVGVAPPESISAALDRGKEALTHAVDRMPEALRAGLMKADGEHAGQFRAAPRPHHAGHAAAREEAGRGEPARAGAAPELRGRPPGALPRLLTALTEEELNQECCNNHHHAPVSELVDARMTIMGSETSNPQDSDRSEGGAPACPGESGDATGIARRHPLVAGHPAELFADAVGRGKEAFTGAVDRGKDVLRVGLSAADTAAQRVRVAVDLGREAAFGGGLDCGMAVHPQQRRHRGEAPSFEAWQSDSDASPMAGLDCGLVNLAPIAANRR